MRNVEHASRFSNKVMFFDLRTIVDGHIPASEVYYLGVSVKMVLIEKGSFAQSTTTKKKFLKL